MLRHVPSARTTCRMEPVQKDQPDPHLPRVRCVRSLCRHCFMPPGQGPSQVDR